MGTRKTVPTHNYSGYRAGCRCEQCREDNKQYEARTRAAAIARLAADPTCAPHGRVHTYQRYRCRCYECRLAHSNQCKRYRARRGKTNREGNRIYRSVPFGREWLDAA